MARCERDRRTPVGFIRPRPRPCLRPRAGTAQQPYLGMHRAAFRLEM